MDNCQVIILRSIVFNDMQLFFLASLPWTEGIDSVYATLLLKFQMIFLTASLVALINQSIIYKWYLIIFHALLIF